MKTPSQRGVTGAWAYQARQEAGLSVEQVAEAMAAKGHAVSPATIRGIESGSKKPGARMLRVLSSVLEAQPPEEPAPASDDAQQLQERLVLAAERSALAAERQADATEALVAFLTGRPQLDSAAVAAALARAQGGALSPLPESALEPDTEQS